MLSVKPLALFDLFLWLDFYEILTRWQSFLKIFPWILVLTAWYRNKQKKVTCFLELIEKGREMWNIALAMVMELLQHS